MNTKLRSKSRAMDNEHKVSELRSLAKALEKALQDSSEYRLARAAQSMRLFCEFCDPSWMRWSREAEKLRSMAEQLAEAMDGIDTDAISEFVRLGRDLA